MQSSFDKYRGHNIHLLEGVWVYSDTLIPVSSMVNRKCGTCGQENTKEGHDGCIPNIKGVVNACCGHGNHRDMYVQLEDGTRLAGLEAFYYCVRNRS